MHKENTGSLLSQFMDTCLIYPEIAYGYVGNWNSELRPIICIGNLWYALPEKFDCGQLKKFLGTYATRNLLVVPPLKIMSGKMIHGLPVLNLNWVGNHSRGTTANTGKTSSKRQKKADSKTLMPKYMSPTMEVSQGLPKTICSPVPWKGPLQSIGGPLVLENPAELGNMQHLTPTPKTQGQNSGTDIEDKKTLSLMNSEETSILPTFYDGSIAIPSPLKQKVQVPSSRPKVSGLRPILTQDNGTQPLMKKQKQH